MAGTIPSEEAERMEAVRRYDILDTPPDGAFDRITALAARIFDVPVSIVSVVDSDRIWFKSHHGLDAEQTDRVPGLCASAICQLEPWVVTNAALDPRTITNPLVAGDMGLRFYAGIPLTTSDGHNLGTFNIIDVEPRELREKDIQTLRDLAAIVIDELELRLASRAILDAAQERADVDHRRAIELNDNVLQGLAAAKLALELDNADQAAALLGGALEATHGIMSRHLEGDETRPPMGPGDFVRATPAEGLRTAQQ